jgi:hypothetical protein
MMLRTDPDAGRERLGFTSEVVKEFRFLNEQFGFQRVATLTTLVSYESRHVFVNIFHGRSSFEIGIEIGQRTDPAELRQKFSMPEILSAVGAPESSGFRGFQASTTKSVRDCVRTLAELVNRYAVPLLNGDPAAFGEVGQAQTTRSSEYVAAMEMRRVRQKVASAWRGKRFGEVVDLLSSVFPSLTPAEKKKLSFARKQTSKQDHELQPVR